MRAARIWKRAVEIVLQTTSLVVPSGSDGRVDLVERREFGDRMLTAGRGVLSGRGRSPRDRSSVRGACAVPSSERHDQTQYGREGRRVGGTRDADDPWSLLPGASGARLTPLATRRTVMLEQRNVTSSFPFRPWSSLGDGSPLGPLGQPGVFGQHAARVPGLEPSTPPRRDSSSPGATSTSMVRATVSITMRSSSWRNASGHRRPPRARRGRHRTRGYHPRIGHR